MARRKLFGNAKTVLKAFGRDWVKKTRSNVSGDILKRRSGRLFDSIILIDRTRKNPAQIAVEAAKPLCQDGKTITIVWEAGLQSLDPINFSGPKWEQETGCKIKVVEVATPDMFTKIMQEYRANTGAYDALNVIPAWMPDLAQAGALEQLDSYVDKYGYRDELQTIAATYRDNQMTVDGKIYGFPDDGDVFLMYYRKDIFAREDLQKAFKKKHGYDLIVPETWEQFIDIGSFLTDALKSEGIYGASMFREPVLSPASPAC